MKGARAQTPTHTHTWTCTCEISSKTTFTLFRGFWGYIHMCVASSNTFLTSSFFLIKNCKSGYLSRFQNALKLLDLVLLENFDPSIYSLPQNSLEETLTQ